MTAPVPLAICGCDFQGRREAAEIERGPAHPNTAAAIIHTGARLRARAILRFGGLNEANDAVHAALWRLLRHGVDLATMSEDALQATLDEILPT